MRQQLLDYDKCLAIIASCTNSRHNNTAYRVCQQFEKMYGESKLSNFLFEFCDDNLWLITEKAGV